jgi:preprotein translocase subunit YajC
MFFAFLQSIPVPVSSQQGPGPAQAQNPMGGGLMMFMPIVMIAFIFFTQWRKGKKDKEVLATLKKGDRVVSQSGLIGELVEMDARIAKVQISRGTIVQMLVTSLSPLDPPEGTRDAKDTTNAKEPAKAESK